MYFDRVRSACPDNGGTVFCLVLLMLGTVVVMRGQDSSLSQIYLEIEPKSVLQQGTVSFVRSYADKASAPAPQEKDALIGYSTDNDFKLAIDRQSISFDQYGNYSFRIFVTPLSKGKGFTFYVLARPQGTFGDFEDAVTFHLHNRGKDSSGTIPLALHTVGSNDLLDIAKAISTPETIKLSGTIAPTIRLRSTLPNFALQIMQVDVKSDCGDCWQGLAAPNDLQAGSAGRILTAKGQEAEISFAGRPRTWPSLRTSLTRFRMSDSHDNLALRVTYAPVEGGRVRTQDFSIPVRFSPSIWEIVLLFILGTALGILVRRPLGQADAYTKKQIGIVAGTVLVSEFILYATVSDTHPLILFGFNADPTQPLAIFVIALLVSGGPRLTQWISEVASHLWDLAKATQVQKPAPGGNP